MLVPFFRAGQLRAERQARAGRWAFTCIELLVVVGMVAILAVLVLLPLKWQARRGAREEGCRLNLKRTAVALSVCVDDNNGWLPPGADATEGLTMGQPCSYRDTAAHKTRLTYYLATYLGCPPPGASNRVVKTFLCPGVAPEDSDAAHLAAEPVCYGVPQAGMGTEPGTPGLAFNPFGAPAAAGSPQPPHRLTELQAFRSLSDLWALTDVDQESFSQSLSGCQEPLPARPAHGRVRNYLYFDGHITPKNIAPKLSQDGSGPARLAAGARSTP